MFPFNSSGDIISTEHVRTSMLEKIYVEYVAYACGGGCPRLTEIYQDKNGKDILSKHALFTNYPDDIENPEDTKLGFSGNRFILTAYRGLVMQDRRQYQDTQELTNHLYVIGWEIVTPYSFYSSKTPLAEVIEKSEPVKQFSKIKTFN